MSDCILCSAKKLADSPEAYLGGIAMGAGHVIMGDGLPAFCDEHRAYLTAQLESRELRLVAHDDHFHIAGKDEEISFDEKK